MYGATTPASVGPFLGELSTFCLELASPFINDSSNAVSVTTISLPMCSPGDPISCAFTLRLSGLGKHTILTNQNLVPNLQYYIIRNLLHMTRSFKNTHQVLYIMKWCF